MKAWNCIVVRKQQWAVTVEAETKKEACSKADEIAAQESPHDDWAYSTEAHEDYSAKPSKK